MRRLLPLLVLAALSSTLLFWNLGGRSLWQDEAACALLSQSLMEHGKPLAYDGTNLVTMDVSDPNRSAGEAMTRHGGAPEAAVAFFHENGDYKEDTTWIGQPWGQFVLAGLSMELFGRDTVPARLPFVVAGILTVLVLFALTRRRLGDSPGAFWTAWIAAALLCGNVFWFLHVRQCRYYSSATLLMLLTVASYLRWRDAKRWGPALFVASAWAWFHNDFGSPVPVLGVLLVDALLRERERWKGTLATFAVLGLTLLPFVLYYELGGRLKASDYSWSHRLLALLWNANQYQLPLLLVVPIGVLIARSRSLSSGTRRLLVLALVIPLAQVLWMSVAAPMGFYRYIVACTPFACLVLAFAFVRAAELVTRSTTEAPGRFVPPISGALALVWLATPWLSLPVTHLIPRATWANDGVGTVLRPELAAWPNHLGNPQVDPNRATVEFLKNRLRPGDEIAVNYEDLPLAFYTGHPVRGGIPVFRLFDEGGTFPRFFVFRPYVNFVYTDLFQMFVREGEKHGRWYQHKLASPGVIWGNNPDPIGYATAFASDEELEPVQVFELLPMDGR